MYPNSRNLGIQCASRGGGEGERKEKKNDFDKVTKSKHQLIIVTLQVSLRKQMLIVTVNRN